MWHSARDSPAWPSACVCHWYLPCGDLVEHSAIQRRDISDGTQQIPWEAPVYGMQVVHRPGLQVFTPDGAADGNHRIVLTLAVTDDPVSRLQNQRHARAGTGRADREVSHVRSVDDLFIEAAAACGG